MINVKGKGVLESFWLDLAKTRETGSGTASGVSLESVDSPTPSTAFHSIMTVDAQKQDRLVNWMTDLFVRRMESIVARQDPQKVGKCGPSSLVYKVPEGKTSLDEVAEVIKMPKFDAAAEKRSKARGTVKIPKDVVDQLHDIVQELAEM